MIHTNGPLDLAEDLPVVVIIVDEPDRIRAFLSELDGLVGAGAMLLDEVEVVRHQGKPAT